MPEVPQDKINKFIEFFKLNLKKLEIPEPINYNFEFKGNATTG